MLHHLLVSVALAFTQCGNTTTYCAAPSKCCTAQYSPTTQGCTAPTAATTCCKPGPELPPSTTLKNCLIIGDSVSIGYTPYVTRALQDVCQVQHGPWDIHDGGASTIQYCTQCLDNWLVTQAQAPVKWDVIFFNSGLHNLSNDTKSQDEYATLLGGVSDRLMKTGATLMYGLTTPFMPLSSKGEMVAERLNSLAAQNMWKRKIPIVDLYTVVTQHCGAVYQDCDWCKIHPCSYHYNGNGYEALAEVVSYAIRKALL